MRVLGRIRLSRSNEESTSVERQRELIENWAKDEGHEVVGWAEDLDVSGSVDPFTTEGLGPWLTEPQKIDQWDILVSWKMDRLARRALSMHRLFEFCTNHDKKLHCTAESIDLTSPTGRMLAGLIAMFAEAELDAIRERTKASRSKLVSSGRWTGGRPTYGYQAVERDGGGWVLEPDPESSAVLREVVDAALAGKSTAAIVADLNERGIRTPADHVRYRNGKPERGAKWKVTPLLDLLRSKTILGQIIHNGEVVRDLTTGQPILGGPPLITFDEFKRLQIALEERSRKQSVDRVDASPMLGIAVCYVCGANLYHQRQTSRGVLYRYYKCLNRCGQQISADTVEELVEQAFLDELGEVEALERVYIPAENHQNELEAAESSVADLTRLLVSTRSESMKKSFREQLSALDFQISELEKLPTSEARTELRPTGKLYKDTWSELDDQGRRELLTKAGITARIKVVGRPRGGRSPGSLHFELRIPEDLRERMAA